MRSVTATLLSVNVGRPKVRDWAGIGRTSIEKHAVAGPVAVRAARARGRPGLRHRAPRRRRPGGLRVRARGPRPRGPSGSAGRSATASSVRTSPPPGIDVNEAEVGERWRIGTAVLEVASVRIPCNDFKNWMGHSGYDDTAWVKRFAAEGRPGPYLRVVDEGVARRRATRSRSCTGPGTASRSARCSRRSPRGASCCRSCCASTAWSTRPGCVPRSTSRAPDPGARFPPDGRSATGT